MQNKSKTKVNVFHSNNIPAQFLYEIAAISADYFREIDPVNAMNGCSEGLQWIRAVKQESIGKNIIQSEKPKPETGKISWESRASQTRKAYPPLRSSNTKTPRDQRSANVLWPWFKMTSGAM